MAGQAGRRQIWESIVHYVSESNFTPQARGSHEKMLSRVGAWLVADTRKLSGNMASIRLEKMKNRTRERASQEATRTTIEGKDSGLN